MEGYIKGPWKCSICGGISESLDEPYSGERKPGSEAVYICKSCKSCSTPLCEDLSEDESWV